MSSHETKRVTVAGATGALGGLITRALLARPNVEVSVLVRPGSREKASELERAGARVVEASLDGDRETLRRALEGTSTVVSAITGGPDVIVDGQLALLSAAREVGATRFLPSDFSFDFFALGEGENINSDWRRQFAVASQGARGPVQVVHMMNGCFLDMGVLFGFLGAFDVERGLAFLWGDGKAKMDFTTYADTAAYTARAATDAEVPDRFEVAADTLDFEELVAAYERGSGRKIEVVRRGSLADLDAEIDRRRAAEPANVYAWLPLMYWRGMVSGKGRLKNPIHARYPEIQPVRVEAYVAAHLGAGRT